MESGLWNCRRWHGESPRWRPGPQLNVPLTHSNSTQLPSPASAQSREVRCSPMGAAARTRRVHATLSCGTPYPWLLSITKRVETHSLLQGSNLCVFLRLHFCKILGHFDGVRAVFLLPSHVLPFRTVVGCGSVIRLALSIHIFTVQEVLTTVKESS